MKWLKRTRRSDIERYMQTYEGTTVLTNRGRDQARLRHEAQLFSGFSGIGGTVHVLDVFFRSDHQAEILHTLSERYPKEFMNIDPERWGEKLSAMHQQPEVLSGYVNGVSGYQAELLAKQFLEESGYQVEMAPTVNYPNSDLFIMTDDGVVPVQVKTLADSTQLDQAIVENQGIVEHYVVNDELYRQLESSGRLDAYEGRGLTIWNGGYENESLRSDAVEALTAPNTLAEHADHFETGGLETIPVVSLVLAFYRSSQAIGRFRRNDLNGYEVTGQISGELSGIGIRGLTAGTAGWIGLTLLGPVGLIGGVYLGGRTGAKWTHSWKQRLSFGEIMFVQERAAQSVRDDWFLDWVIDVLFEAPHIKERVSLLKNPSVNGEIGIYLQHYVLAEYARYERRLDGMRNRFHEVLMRAVSTQKECSAERLTGELLLQLYPMTHTYAPTHWSEDYRQYVTLQRKTPHYPDQLSIPAYAFVEQVADEVLREEGFA